MKSKAYLLHTSGGLYEALDLRAKTYTFTATDAAACLDKMHRSALSLYFSCTFVLNASRDPSILRQMISQPVVQVPYGSLQKFVRVEASRDARTVTFATRIDDVGLDHKMAQFNDELYKVLAKSADDIIFAAMTLEPLELRVLESPHAMPVAATPPLTSPRPLAHP